MVKVGSVGLAREQIILNTVDAKHVVLKNQLLIVIEVVVVVVGLVVVVEREEHKKILIGQVPECDIYLLLVL